MAAAPALNALKAGGRTWGRYREQHQQIDLIGADLAGASLPRANLSGSNLREANLDGVDLTEANLGGADLSRATLIGAHLTRADLTGTDLTGTDMEGTNLIGATMTRANLGGANLIGAQLIGAQLRTANLGGVNLKESAMVGVDLTGAYLRKADLTMVNLTRANLYGADLVGANLDQTNLSGANLSGANLVGAKLVSALIRETNLHEANLHGADLTSANLTRANLRGANLRDSMFAGTQLTNLDLSETFGLEHAMHDEPSSLGVDTLYRSRGAIPDVFLQAIGLTDLFITYARETIKAEAGPLFPYYSAFLSYSHADQAAVRVIYEQLTQRTIPCWLDEHQLKPSDKIDVNVDRAIRGADKVLVFCSRASLSPGSNWWVDREIGRALDEERDRSRRQEADDISILLPVDLDGYLFSDECVYAHKRDLTRRIAATYRPGDNPTESIVQALSTRNARPYQPFFDPARHR